MYLNSTFIDDTFAEAFRMWYARLIVTAAANNTTATTTIIMKFKKMGIHIQACG